MRQLQFRFFLASFILSALVTLPPATPAAAAGTDAPPPVDVEPELEAALRAHGETALLIDFAERPDLSPAFAMDWDARGRFVVDRLRATAERSQARVRAHLQARGVAFESFWIDNLIFVPAATRGILDDLVAFDEIEILRADREMILVEPVARASAGEQGRFVEPNISHVKADAVWSLGIDGTGLVVAGIDTGVRFTHDTLEPRYRGNLGGGSFDHDYNWLSGNGGSATPSDGNGHGTHTVGTMVGDDGGANQIGMAPGATWIACSGCPNGNCTTSALLTCAQWIAAPYPVGSPGSPDPSKRPHVVNNSWGDC
jgi:subtilisin family serine protease